MGGVSSFLKKEGDSMYLKKRQRMYGPDILVENRFRETMGKEITYSFNP